MVSDPRRYAIGFVGLGLIGGSLALALKKAGFASSVIAWDSDPSVLERAAHLGVIDAAAHSVSALMQSVEIAVLACPTQACEPLILDMLNDSGSAICVTDVASVKGELYRAVVDAAPKSAAIYVPGHPIAGSERSGVAAADAALFERHRVILTPDSNTDPLALGLVQKLWAAAGATVQCMDVLEHDQLLAATSHLPHVLAYALVDALAQSPIREDIFRFAAGGFRDFTRIASSDPVMWRDIALANRDALLAAMDDFCTRLEALRSSIAARDGAALESTFRSAKTVRDEFARDLALRDSGSS
ncbi:prephenate dehydrogenase/arogenate dehydrogenase family protein [Congregibacter variabilis]|uniref:Prephenate dehydrogenase/arogenate dehydrogenase family protein n=1 Tax=Congregibacter variabilis TaxID=3081200 RepID=A0ABZ0I5T5_9GAMM|nr:prephenate dehydrogenase/arogenate dehydrogenase family protein [Congregibacter sp. IMCC43200]